MTAAPIPFVKGHGTGNDFVVLPDPGGREVTDRVVAALCDRRLGLGADGVLVVARVADSDEVAHLAGQAEFFMDYRNADGSRAQMCGNGARVFAAFLMSAGLVGPGPFRIATRGGTREVSVDPDGQVRVGMGPAAFIAEPGIVVRAEPAADPSVAVGVLMPNPHAVTWVEDVAAAGTLRSAPVVTPAAAYPEGVNVEFVQVLGPDRIRMRVHERGVGETLSCGTGACAAAVATVRRAGGDAGGPPVTVEVPGGTLRVVWRADGEVELIGPAVLVASGGIVPTWWEQHV